MEYTFDQLKEQDLKKINLIINTPEVKEYFNFGSSLSLQQTKNWYKEVIGHRENNNGECIVIRNLNGEILGWCYFFENFLIDTKIKKIIQVYCESRCVYIAATVINPKFFGRGLGKKLITYSEKVMKSQKMNFVWFGTNSDNIKIKKLHEGLNYQILGTINKFKKRTESEWINQDIYGKTLS